MLAVVLGHEECVKVSFEMGRKNFNDFAVITLFNIVSHTSCKCLHNPLIALCCFFIVFYHTFFQLLLSHKCNTTTETDGWTVAQE